MPNGVPLGSRLQQWRGWGQGQEHGEVPWSEVLSAFKTYAESGAAGHQGMNRPEANKAQSRRLYKEVFGQGNYHVADQILAEHHVSHGPGTPPVSGSAAIKRQAQLLRTALPDFAVELVDQLADADRVASRWRATGTHTGPLHLPGTTAEPTGQPVCFEEIRIDRYHHEQIAESWFIPDRMTLWQQLGLFPSP
jgi:predicted ester cyclase